jgi:hypothetical protein
MVGHIGEKRKYWQMVGHRGDRRGTPVDEQSHRRNTSRWSDTLVTGEKYR